MDYGIIALAGVLIGGILVKFADYKPHIKKKEPPVEKQERTEEEIKLEKSMKEQLNNLLNYTGGVKK